MTARPAARAARAALVALLLAACDHGAPFVPDDYSPHGPFSPTRPIRLTLNPGTDQTPTWLADGSGILYSAERLDRPDRDHCLAELPPDGGAIRRWACRTTAADDSINVLENPAVSSDGRLVYVRSVGSLRLGRPLGPSGAELVLASLAAPATALRVLQPIPTGAPGGRIHEAISHIAWLGPSRLVYLEERVRYPRACSSCIPDTVRTGLELVTLDFTTPTPVLAVVPGTDGASSVAVGATGDTIYFTRNGDARVYRRAFSSGQTDTVFDFSFAGIARDVDVANGRLVAVVGGAVTYAFDSILGESQVDDGGQLHLVILATGTDSLLGDVSSYYRRPSFRRLIASGGRLVAEQWLGGFADLWLLDVP